jgi:hypothetical protein
MSKLEMMNRVHDILYLNNIINKKDIYLWDVLEYLVRNQYITYKERNWYKLRCWVTELREPCNESLKEQDEICLTFIYKMIW